MIPLALSAHAGAIVDIIVNAVIDELVGAGVAIELMAIHNPTSEAAHITHLTSHCPNLNRPDRQ